MPENDPRTIFRTERSGEIAEDTCGSYDEDSAINMYLDALRDPGMDAEAYASITFSDETIAVLAQVIDEGDAQGLLDAANIRLA